VISSTVTASSATGSAATGSAATGSAATGSAATGSTVIGSIATGSGAGRVLVNRLGNPGARTAGEASGRSGRIAGRSGAPGGGEPRRGPDPGGQDVTALRMLRRARDRIDRDYAEPAGIDSLAAEAGYSLAHFIRAFRAAYGETPGAYRTRRRVERACELLRSVNLSVTEICYLVGFTSLGSFSSRFSELVGLSPSAYRAEAARRGGPAPIPGCFALMWRTGLPAPADSRT
jgi:AraC-like DNA-binding protein